MLVEVVTQPNYTVLHVYSVALLSFGLGGGSIFALPYIGMNFLAWFALLFFINGVFMFTLWDYPAAKAAASCNLAYNTKTEKN